MNEDKGLGEQRDQTLLGELSNSLAKRGWKPYNRDEEEGTDICNVKLFLEVNKGKRGT